MDYDLQGQNIVNELQMGRTGKSVARSYMAALDCLIPVEASISGTIAMNKDKPLQPRFQIIRDRYNTSLTYLKSSDDHNPGKTKLTTYVEKQEKWNHQVEQYAVAQERQLDIIAKKREPAKKQREDYLEWVQTHARDYKASIQARYMDWVVHGYKFEVEFNFGVVDISSGMKRVESSKEAYRNLTLIASDGASEYAGVNLMPSNWAKHVKAAVDNWAAQNSGPSPLEIRSEINRLKRLLVSHEALKASVDGGQYLGFAPNRDDDKAADEALKGAYSLSYSTLSEVNKQRSLARPGFKKEGSADSSKAEIDKAIAARDGQFDTLRAAQQNWTTSHLSSNKKTVQAIQGEEQKSTLVVLEQRIQGIRTEIKQLADMLYKNTMDKASDITVPQAQDAEGKTIEPHELKRDPELFTEVAKDNSPSPWTRVTCKVSQKEAMSTKVTEESASSFAAKVNSGFWSASGGASHTSAAAKSSASMANLDVEISMDCMLVEIERPWLHAELFSDHDLDAADAFPLSPGPESLHVTVSANNSVDAKYAEFCSYPNAFVIAANVQLEFSGDTSSLESAISSSSTEANLSVGYGPFSVSGSHKQSKSKSKTKAESTATGMRVSLQAPQIIAWVQELLPELPKPKEAGNKMFGLTLQPRENPKALVAAPAAPAAARAA